MTRTAIIPRGRALPPVAVAVLPLGAGGTAIRCGACVAEATWDGVEPVHPSEWALLRVDRVSDLRCDCECHVAGEPCGGAK